MRHLFKICFIFISASPSVNGAESAKNLGGFFAPRVGVLDGSTTYQNVSHSIKGTTFEGLLGIRPISFFNIGIVGIFDVAKLSRNSTEVGQLTSTGYGGYLRLFFVPRIYFEGGGGQSQFRLEKSDPQGGELLADGTFYYMGPGLELYLGKWISLEISFKIRKTTFAKKEFENMATLNLSGLFDFYF